MCAVPLASVKRLFSFVPHRGFFFSFCRRFQRRAEPRRLCSTARFTGSPPRPPIPCRFSLFITFQTNPESSAERAEAGTHAHTETPARAHTKRYATQSSTASVTPPDVRSSSPSTVILRRVTDDPQHTTPRMSSSASHGDDDRTLRFRKGRMNVLKPPPAPAPLS